MAVFSVREKIRFLNALSSIRRKLFPKTMHVSNYFAGHSPATDRLPVLNYKGKVIGTEQRSVCEKEALLHPTIHLLLYNKKGDLLIQRRALTKASSGGKLSQSVGGHVSASEINRNMTFDPIMTLRKETFEELGIDLDIFNNICKYFYRSNNGLNYELVHLYQGLTNSKIRPNYSELDWAAYFKPEDIMSLLFKDRSLFSKSLIKDLMFVSGNWNY